MRPLPRTLRTATSSSNLERQQEMSTTPSLSIGAGPIRRARSKHLASDTLKALKAQGLVDVRSRALDYENKVIREQQQQNEKRRKTTGQETPLKQSAMRRRVQRMGSGTLKSSIRKTPSSAQSTASRQRTPLSQIQWTKTVQDEVKPMDKPVLESDQSPSLNYWDRLNKVLSEKEESEDQILTITDNANVLEKSMPAVKVVATETVQVPDQQELKDQDNVQWLQNTLKLDSSSNEALDKLETQDLVMMEIPTQTKSSIWGHNVLALTGDTIEWRQGPLVHVCTVSHQVPNVPLIEFFVQSDSFEKDKEKPQKHSSLADLDDEMRLSRDIEFEDEEGSLQQPETPKALRRMTRAFSELDMEVRKTMESLNDSTNESTEESLVQGHENWLPGWITSPTLPGFLDGMNEYDVSLVLNEPSESAFKTPSPSTVTSPSHKLKPLPPLPSRQVSTRAFEGLDSLDYVNKIEEEKHTSLWKRLLHRRIHTENTNTDSSPFVKRPWTTLTNKWRSKVHAT